MPSFAEIRDVFAGIPGVVWGAVVSAAFTLLTVTLTERRNIKRTREQREHDSLEKARDRTMTLRREVYMPVMAEFNAAMNFLATMPSHTIDVIGKAEPLNAFATAAAKLSLVSSPTTAIAIHRLSVECGALRIRFAQVSIDIAQAQGQIDIHSKLRDGHIAEMNRINATLKEINEAGERDDRRFGVLGEQYKFARKLFDQEVAAIDELTREHQHLYGVFGRTFLPALRGLLDKSIQAMVAMRQDLGQEDVAEDLIRELKANAERLYSMAEASFAQLSESADTGSKNS